MLGRLSIAMGLLFSCSATFAAEDVNNGMIVFMANCAACHSITPDQHKSGPSLAGVFGRTAGSLQGFEYSSTLAKEEFEWNDATLFEYLTVPTQTGGGDEVLVHGVAMGFEGVEVKSAEDLIAFLKRF